MDARELESQFRNDMQVLRGEDGIQPVLGLDNLAHTYYLVWPLRLRGIENAFDGEVARKLRHVLAEAHKVATLFLIESIGEGGEAIWPDSEFAREWIRLGRGFEASPDTVPFSSTWPHALGAQRYELPSSVQSNIDRAQEAMVRWRCTTSKNQPAEPKPAAAPTWNRDTGELSYDGKIVKKVKNLGSAKHVVAVLNAFQESGWPPRIDDPLPNGRNPERLRYTINRSLNRNLSEIRFLPDGTGEGVRWEAMC